jgi:hypothetical protein
VTYEEFEATAMELFGMDPDEAATLAEQMSGEYDLDRIDADSERFWAEAVEYEAVDMALAEYEEPEYEDRYELDPRFPGDEWLDADVEWEMTAETDDSYMETT